MTSAERADTNFWLDLENWVLQNRWDARAGTPVGPRRHIDTTWREVMLQELEDYPRNTIEQYEAFVLAGNGDEWFQEGEAGTLMYRANVPVFCAQVNGRSEPSSYLRRFGEAGSGALPDRRETEGRVHYTGGGSPIRRSAKRRASSPATPSFGWPSDRDGSGPSLAA